MAKAEPASAADEFGSCCPHKLIQLSHLDESRERIPGKLEMTIPKGSDESCRSGSGSEVAPAGRYTVLPHVLLVRFCDRFTVDPFR